MAPMPDDGRDADDPTTLTPDDTRSADDGSALAPDELDIEDDENVVSLDEGRYVIGTDERPDVPADAGGAGESGNAGAGSGGSAGEAGDGNAAGENAAAGDATAGEAAGGPAPDDRPSSAVDSAEVKQVLEADLDGVSSRYGFHVSAKSEEAISHQQMFSDDVGTVFDGLLRWYAQQLTTETAVEDVLGILLTESNVRVRYSPSCLQAILESYDLGPDDSIADLVEAVQDDRGMVFPPENV